jgi:uncharacterized protein YneF (UPF0154 family)
MCRMYAERTQKVEKKMLLEPIPPMTEEQWAAIEKEMKRKPSKADIERIKRAKKTFKNCPL